MSQRAKPDSGSGLAFLDVFSSALAGVLFLFVIGGIYTRFSTSEDSSGVARQVQIQPAEEVETYEVVKFTDGDTIRIMMNGVNESIRLEGIDAPELKQPFGKKSQQALKDLIGDNRVAIQGSERDRYGRLLARVIVNGEDTSLRMVQLGMAWRYLHSKDEKLAAAEAIAHQGEVGLWSQPAPTAPWDFRN